MTRGLAYVLIAYLLWGFLPLFWKELTGVPAFEVIGHRIAWSAVLLWGAALVRRRFQWLHAGTRNPRTALTFLTTGALLSANWVTYVWAITHDRVVDASLGYFINPLFSVALGFVFLKERLPRLQQIAVLVAAVGVLWITVASGRPPWIALALAVTFGVYGLLRKTAALGALGGLSLELTYVTLPALIYLVWLDGTGEAAWRSAGPRLDFLLVACGLATAAPLWFFAAGARRVTLATVGITQFLAPSIQCALGVFLYGEPLAGARLVGFVWIWAGLGLYAASLVRRRPGTVG